MIIVGQMAAYLKSFGNVPASIPSCDSSLMAGFGHRSGRRHRACQDERPHISTLHYRIQYFPCSFHPRFNMSRSPSNSVPFSLGDNGVAAWNTASTSFSGSYLPPACRLPCRPSRTTLDCCLWIRAVASARPMRGCLCPSHKRGLHTPGSGAPDKCVTQDTHSLL